MKNEDSYNLLILILCIIGIIFSVKLLFYVSYYITNETDTHVQTQIEESNWKQPSPYERPTEIQPYWNGNPIVDMQITIYCLNSDRLLYNGFTNEEGIVILPDDMFWPNGPIKIYAQKDRDGFIKGQWFIFNEWLEGKKGGGIGGTGAPRGFRGVGQHKNRWYIMVEKYQKFTPQGEWTGVNK